MRSGSRSVRRVGRSSRACSASFTEQLMLGPLLSPAPQLPTNTVGTVYGPVTGPLSVDLLFSCKRHDFWPKLSMVFSRDSAAFVNVDRLARSSRPDLRSSRSGSNAPYVAIFGPGDSPEGRAREPPMSPPAWPVKRFSRRRTTSSPFYLSVIARLSGYSPAGVPCR